MSKSTIKILAGCALAIVSCLSFAAPGGYTIRGQWYTGSAYTRYFSSGESLLSLNIPKVNKRGYLLTAHVFVRPKEIAGRAQQVSILCSVGREGAPAGSGQATWFSSDGTSTVAISVVGTFIPENNLRLADLRCYGGGDLAVAQASLTAIPISNLQQQPFRP
jgi:hypothetical protein